MPFTPWNTAHGEAAPVLLRCEPTTALGPMDDSVDTNTVVIEGAGTIVSFGDCQRHVLKRVKFMPLVLREADERAPPGGGGGGGAVIELVNSAQLNLLSGQRRSINGVAYGMYHCDGANNWNEVYFAQQGTFTANVIDARIEALEARVTDLEQRTKTLEEKS